MNTPFFNQMAAVCARGPRFFVPGHKGNTAAIPAFGQFLHWDLTEVEGAYDLSCPQGALAQSEENMSRAFNSGATLYSAFGSSSCIMAMLALFCGRGGTVAMGRTVHLSAVRALALLGISPEWIPLENGVLTPGAAEAALKKSGAKTLYVTSPDYYGNMADIPALAAVCKKYDARLLADNAHGAYLAFLNPTRHPLALGADACADSAHKTLPCLTPAALLHLKDPALKNKARAALNLFCGTSPSYPVLQSLDLAAGMLLSSPPNFEAAAARFAAACGVFAEITAPCAEPLKAVLRPALCGLCPKTFNSLLLKEGIACEYFDGESIVLMASPWNTEADFAALETALLNVKEKCPKNTYKITDNISTTPAPPLPKTVLPPRDAFFAQQESIPLQSAEGRVMAGICAPCPPGTPLVMPGEEITKDGICLLASGGISSVDVVK